MGLEAVLPGPQNALYDYDYDYSTLSWRLYWKMYWKMTSIVYSSLTSDARSHSHPFHQPKIVHQIKI